VVRRETERERRDARFRVLDAMTHQDKCFVLGYLASSVPDAFDLAIAALAGTLLRDSRPPGPV
jgi:hypothetical protein